MTCVPLMRGGKQVGFICGNLRKNPPKCAFCDKPSTKLCDYPLDRNHTCDMCRCVTSTRKNKA